MKIFNDMKIKIFNRRVIIMKWLIISIIILFFKNIQGQSLSSDLKVIYSSYANIDKFYSKVFVNIYNSQSSTSPMYTLNAEIKKKGENYLYSLGDVDILSNKSYMLVINHKERKIILSGNKGKKKFDYELTNEDFDSLISVADLVSYDGLIGNTKKYSIIHSNYAIQKMELFIDNETNFFSKIIYYYNPHVNSQSSKVEIEYKDLNLEPEFTTDEFDENRYITVTNSGIIPAGKYLTYDLVITD